jgi:hypothetical protein
MRYRKLPGRLHEWHIHPLCPEWPVYGFVEHETHPNDNICATCISMNNLEAELAEAQSTEKKR